jgi:hypothetical protein
LEGGYLGVADHCNAMKLKICSRNCKCYRRRAYYKTDRTITQSSRLYNFIPLQQRQDNTQAFAQCIRRFADSERKRFANSAQKHFPSSFCYAPAKQLRASVSFALARRRNEDDLGLLLMSGFGGSVGKSNDHHRSFCAALW